MTPAYDAMALNPSSSVPENLWMSPMAVLVIMSDPACVSVIQKEKGKKGKEGKQVMGLHRSTQAFNVCSCFWQIVEVGAVCVTSC